jgi:hypothetical protein
MKKRRGNHVHPLVGALGTEDNGNEQFEGVAVVQLRFGYGHGLFKVSDDFIV